MTEPAEKTTEVELIHIGLDGHITRQTGRLDTKGGIRDSSNTKRWVSQPGDAGTCDNRILRWGGRESDVRKTAYIVYEADSVPVPVFPKAIRGEVPDILDTYIRGRFMRDLVVHQQDSEGAATKALRDFLKRIPRWALLCIFVVVAGAVMWLTGAFDDIQFKFW